MLSSNESLIINNNNNNNKNNNGNNNSNNNIKTIKNNIQACMEIYYHLKSTLGPYGRDKLIVDRNNNYLSTNDGATVLQYLKITHPAARLLIGVAKSQDETVGDGTTSVVLLTCSLLQNSLKYILLSIHPIIFIKGFQISLDFCLKVIDEIKISPTTTNNNNNKEELSSSLFENESFLNHLYSVASTSISSKILARYSDHFSKIGVEAIKKLKFNQTQDLIRVVGINGNSMLESTLIDGILLEINNNQLNSFKIGSNSDNSNINNILNNPSIIIGKLQLNKNKNEQIQGIKYILNKNNNGGGVGGGGNKDEIEEQKQDDDDIELKNKINIILKNKINIIISDTEIPSWIETIFKENAIIYFNVQDSRELEILSHCIGCSLIYDLLIIDRDTMISKPESIEIKSIGDKFFLKVVGSSKSTNSNNNKTATAATVILRSPTDTTLQECIRSFKDMLNILSSTARNPYLIGGGGSTYIELSKRLREKSNKMFKNDEKLMISINCFADSLEMIPMILIQNAGYDSLDLLGKLKSIHNDHVDNGAKNQHLWKGINLNNGKIVDMIKDLNVKEPSFLLSNILTLSSRAAQMILRINNNIMIEPRSQFKPPSS